MMIADYKYTLRAKTMETPKTVDLIVDDVAKELGVSCESFYRKLSLIGWCHLLDEAERLAHIDQWKINLTLMEKRTIRDCEITYEHLVRAAKLIITPMQEM